MRPVLPLSDLLVGHIWIIERSRFRNSRIRVFLLSNHKSMTAVARFSNIVFWRFISNETGIHFRTIGFSQKTMSHKYRNIFTHFQLKQWNYWNESKEKTLTVKAFSQEKINVIAFIQGNLVCSDCIRLCFRMVKLECLVALYLIEYLPFNMTSRSTIHGTHVAREMHNSRKESMSTATIRKIYCESVQRAIFALLGRCPSFRLPLQLSPSENRKQLKAEFTLRSEMHTILHMDCREECRPFDIAISTPHRKYTLLVLGMSRFNWKLKTKETINTMPKRGYSGALDTDTRCQFLNRIECKYVEMTK